MGKIFYVAGQQPPASGADRDRIAKAGGHRPVQAVQAAGESGTTLRRIADIDTGEKLRMSQMLGEKMAGAGG
ncbi:MAG: hypothetical protein H5U01_14265, partial [Clostridia bacterium]|nr:hypothetical protein [Clostridia bacterium]